MTRDHLDMGEVCEAANRVLLMCGRRIKEKGPGAYAGPHECFGIIAEEYDELRDAMRANDGAQFRKELLDIAVACVIGMASMLPGDTSAETTKEEEVIQ